MFHDAATKAVNVFLFSIIIGKNLYISKINSIFAIAKTKAEVNITIDFRL